MSLSELGGGKISCADFKNILRGAGRSAKNVDVGEYCVFNYDDVGGLIDMEQGRLNGPSLIQMIISLIIMFTKYIILFLISKIEYVAIVFAIYLLVMIFLKIWRWLFDGQTGIIGKAVCGMFNYTLKITIPDWFPYDSGKELFSVQPFNFPAGHGILSPVANLIGCPAGADKLFDNKYGTCEQRFAGEGTGCLNTYATDFTLYTENKNGTANKDSICNNIGNCINAPEHNIIKDSIGFPVIGLPMVGLKGIGFGTAPFKYLECCPNGHGFTGSTSTNRNSKCSLEYKMKAWQASLASSASPQEFKIKYTGITPMESASGTPFEEFNMYSITNSNFDEFHIYNTDNKTCVNSGFFADLEDDLSKVINYIKIIFWILIALLILIQVNTFVKRMYYGYILCETYDDALHGEGKSNFDDTLLGIMSKKDPNHKIKELNSKVESTVEEFEEKFPVCGHLLYCLNNKLPRKCENEGDLNLQLHHKGNLISTLHKNGDNFKINSGHSSGVDCFNKQHDIVSEHHNEISAKKTAVKNAKAVAASKGESSTLLGGDVPPEAFLIIIFSFVSGTIMMIINYMKKK